MVQRPNRIRDLVVANADVIAAVPEADIHTEHFPTGLAWPVPGILFQSLDRPTDPDTWCQDLVFTTRCYGLSHPLASALHQTLRTALTGYGDFAVPAPAQELTQKPLWLARGILRINIETGGQRAVEPNSGQSGREFVLAQYRAEFAET